MLTRRYARVLLAPAMAVAFFGATGCGGLSEGDYVYYKIAIGDEKAAESCYAENKVPDSVKDDSTTLRSGASVVLYVAGGGSDQALLDVGLTVLSGKLSGDQYTFSGDTVNVEYPPGKTITDVDHDGTEDSDDPMIDADKDGLDDNDAFDPDPEVDTDLDGIDDRGLDPLVDADKDGKDDRIVELASGLKLTSSTNITVDLKLQGRTISGTMKTVTAQKCEGETCVKDYDKSCERTAEFTGVKIEEIQVDLKGGIPVPGSAPGDGG